MIASNTDGVIFEQALVSFGPPALSPSAWVYDNAMMSKPSFSTYGGPFGPRASSQSKCLSCSKNDFKPPPFTKP